MTLNLQAFWCLCLFDGGAAAAGAGDGGASAGAAAGAEGQSGTTGAVPAAARRGKSGEYANVVFGKQAEPQAEAPAAEEQTNTEEQPKPQPLTLKDRRKAYDDFVKGEGMKEIDEQRIQGILDRRLRDHKTMQENLQKQAPLIELLAQRYGVTDVEQLTAKLESDDAYWQDAADDAGMDVEQFKRFKNWSGKMPHYCSSSASVSRMPWRRIS